MREFKVGDRVRVSSPFIREETRIATKGLTGYIRKKTTVINIWYNIEGYDIHSFRGDELELCNIHDSKLARRLYKNQIKEIKDGKIWLK